MFSLLTEKEYLKEKERQEKLAEQCHLEDMDKNEIRRFLSKEERLQAYEFMHIDNVNKNVVLFINLDDEVFYKACVMARRQHMTWNNYILSVLLEPNESNESNETN